MRNQKNCDNFGFKKGLIPSFKLSRLLVGSSKSIKGAPREMFLPHQFIVIPQRQVCHQVLR